MDAAITDQPDSVLLSSFQDGRACEEVIELDMFRNADKIIIQEKSHRFGDGKRYTVTDSRTKTDYYEIKQDTPCQFSLREINDRKRLVNFNVPSRTSCICPCGNTCTMRSQTTLLPNSLLGSVQQTLTWCQPYFNVYDSSNERILSMDGSFSMMFFSIGRHKVTDMDDRVVGDIFVDYSASEGLHCIYVKFNKEMDVSTKLTLLGAGLMFSNAQASRV
ncbi:uncharacterized protein LOC114525150 [Dendronephthya gigantea]|uniref:uncharacterized protein LOC114525150 n=1 Tax=Dendronephthya gigantea TaxID=151771 RepID=UPI00106D6863|nr:uncharacterized protein LOC114525150 [Dendronephthya gigantea]